MNLSGIYGIRCIKFLSVFLFLGVSNLSAQVRVEEENMTRPTYMPAPANKTPIFYNGGSTQGAANYIYPLALNDVTSTQKVDHTYKSLVLENEYIKVGITPEIGGKLYYAIDKTNGNDFIYNNGVVKPGNIGPTGAWVSGGIEWVFFHHHRASGFLHVDNTITVDENGKKTVWIGETEPRQRMRWTVGVSVTPGKSYFEAEMKISNPTPYTYTFLFWANVATHTSKDFQVFFPPSVQFATYHSKNVFTHWPISTELYNGHDFTKGVDVSWWKNSLTSNSFFAYDLKEDFMGMYDHAKNSGTVHIGDHNIVKGAKLWEWGAGARGQATEARLTDNSGPYVEIMVGAFSDNQPDYSWIRPGEVKTWKQYWYPIRDIKGFKNANLNGAVNLELKEDNKVFLGYYSTQKVSKARITLRNGEKMVLQKEVEISPEKSFTQLVKVEGVFKYTDLSTEMINTENNEVLISYKPVELKKEENLPEAVKAPDLPVNIKTVEQLYLTGKRIEQFHNSRYEPMDYYLEAVKRDSADIRSNTAIGNYYLNRWEYTTARSYFSKAIKRLTKDYTRPSTCEVLFQQGLVLKALERYDEAIDTLYRATWDYAWHSAAFFELAQISCLKGDFPKALSQIDESLSTNSKNPRAIALKASLQRRLGDFKGAAKTLDGLLITDPLDFRMANETYLLAKASGNTQRAESELISLTKKMRDFDQNYLELAVGYLNDGMRDEAEDVLQRFRGEYPETNYFRGYIQDKKGNKEQAAKYFKAGSQQSEDNCFPFRNEAIEIFKTALKYNPSDGKAYYYIGNILYDRQPAKAIESWENAVKYSPNLALAYRNLGWGYNQHAKDVKKAILFYEKAISLEKTEPIYYSELGTLYELDNTPIERRLQLFEGINDIVKKRDDSFIRQISILTLAGQPEKAVEYLKGKAFSFREGSSRIREVSIDAQLSLGNKYFEQKNYQKALEHYLEAIIPDEEAGSARSGNRNIQVYYYLACAYEALKNDAKAKQNYKLSAEQSTGASGTMRYYQGLSYLKLGNKTRADEIFKALVSDGDSQINGTANNKGEFFDIFGERDAENARKSQAYTLRGLGHKGLGINDQAKEDLTKAVSISVSNLWAKAELKGTEIHK
jgi:tetratricopeptide (TPR) repeat protein